MDHYHQMQRASPLILSAHYVLDLWNIHAAPYTETIVAPAIRMDGHPAVSGLSHHLLHHMDPQWRRLPEDRRKRGNDEAVVRLPHAVRMRLSGGGHQRPRLVAHGAVRHLEVRPAMDLGPAWSRLQAAAPLRRIAIISKQDLMRGATYGPHWFLN